MKKLGELGDFIECYWCQAQGKHVEACAKIGEAKASIWNALFGFLGGKAWKKTEKYVCVEHFNYATSEVIKTTKFAPYTQGYYEEPVTRIWDGRKVIHAKDPGNRELPKTPEPKKKGKKV